jgi:hypothetical protein
MADKKAHRFRDAIDWARRGHWLWTVFPAGWKAFLAGAFVVGITTILARLKDVPLHLLFLSSLAAVVLYAIGWAAVHRFAARPISKDHRPRLSLEAQRFSGREWDNADYAFTVQNIGTEAILDLSFKPMQHEGWTLQLNRKGTLTPADLKSPVGFTVSNMFGDLEQTIVSLRRFFERVTNSSGGARATFRTQVEADFIDLNRNRKSEIFILECSLPEMAIRVRPTLANDTPPPTVDKDRPRIILERSVAPPFFGSPDNRPVFFIRNLGKRAARFLEFDLIPSQGGNYLVRFEPISLVAAGERTSIDYRDGNDPHDTTSLNGLTFLHLFLEDSPLDQILYYSARVVFKDEDGITEFEDSISFDYDRVKRIFTPRPPINPLSPAGTTSPASSSQP